MAVTGQSNNGNTSQSDTSYNVIAKESTGSTCTCQVQELPVDFQLTICQHEIARNYLQLGSKNLKNCK